MGLPYCTVPVRVKYKLGVTVYRCLQHKAPWYLVDCCRLHQSLTSPLCQLSSADGTTTLVQYVPPFGLCCRWSDGLELTASQPLRPGDQY